MVGGGLGDGGGRGVQQRISSSAGLQLSNVNDPSVPSQRQGLCHAQGPPSSRWRRTRDSVVGRARAAARAAAGYRVATVEKAAVVETAAAAARVVTAE
eukprot:scaffold121439_cov60-Phaeocystis_antarctica.AAC.1